jgi:hypothetical protein
LKVRRVEVGRLTAVALASVMWAMRDGALDASLRLPFGVRRFCGGRVGWSGGVRGVKGVDEGAGPGGGGGGDRGNGRSGCCVGRMRSCALCWLTLRDATVCHARHGAAGGPALAERRRQVVGRGSGRRGGGDGR